MKRVLLLGALSVLLSSCSILGSGDDDGTSPAKLEKFDEEVELRRVWSTDVGNGQGKKYNRLSPVITQDAIYAVANNGAVVAINRTTGDRLWRTRLRDVVVTGGLGYGEGRIFLGTEDSSVIALNSETGETEWTVDVSSEVLSAPQVEGSRVVVQTVDGKLQGLDTETGENVWIYESSVPDLSIRGTATPIIVDDYVITGLGNGTLVSVAIDNGTLRWEQRITVPTGRSEIDRLVDVDANPFLADNGMIVVPSFQGSLAALDPQTGQLRWRTDESSTHGVSAGFGNIYVSSTEGIVTARRINQDESVWQNEELSLRGLSAPVTFNNYVVVGDYKGYVHLLSQVDGSMSGRQRVDKKGMRSVMITRDDMLYVYGNGGNLAAYRIR